MNPMKYKRVFNNLEELTTWYQNWIKGENYGDGFVDDGGNACKVKSDSWDTRHLGRGFYILHDENEMWNPFRDDLIKEFQDQLELEVVISFK